MQPESIMTAEECRMIGEGYCPCPLEDAAGFISKKWTMSVLVTIGNFGTLRFNNLLSRIEKMSPKVLADRLKELEAANLVERKAYAERPPRVEYSLTKKGATLRKAVIPLMNWAVKENHGNT